MKSITDNYSTCEVGQKMYRLYYVSYITPPEYVLYKAVVSSVDKQVTVLSDEKDGEYIVGLPVTTSPHKHYQGWSPSPEAAKSVEIARLADASQNLEHQGGLLHSFQTKEEQQ